MNFSTEEKKLEVLLGGPWTFDNRSFIVKEWSENEDYKCGSVASLSVWVRFPGIKAHMTDITILGKLRSRLGKPICTDGVTAEGSSFHFARICVEIYADQEMIHEIEYEDPYGNCCTQRVVYEWRPPRCTNCYNFGHRKENCLEPNLDAMIAELKEHEDSQWEMKDTRDVVDTNEEYEDETPNDDKVIGKDPTSERVVL